MATKRRYKKSTKKNKNESKVILGKDSTHPLQIVYALMGMLGVIDKEDNPLVTKYEEKSSHLSIAVPSIKFGISLPGDKTDYLKENGWHIESIAPNDLDAFKRVFNSIDSGRVAKVYSSASPNAKTTSKPEEKIYSELIRRGLPIPDRNLRIKRDDGTELTTPDFAWEKEKVAFFMDGAYWHSVHQDEKVLEEIRKDNSFGKKIVSDRKDKVKKDQRIRSDLTVLGWTVLSCTDEEIETQSGVEQQVKNITEVLKREKKRSEFQFQDEESLEDIREILDS